MTRKPRGTYIGFVFAQQGDSVVNKFVQLAIVCVVVLFAASPVLAADEAAKPALINLTGSFGAGLVVIGAAFGIGKLASSAYESMARQPEVAGNIQTAMIIAAALIEGFTFYALFITSTGA
jgi:F-type H+-transporting ATPase subunit c